MEVYRKVVADDGTETYELVDPAQIEVPENHPLNAKLQQVTQESIARRKELKALKQRVDELSSDGDETPAPQPAQPPTTAFDPEAIVTMTVERIAAQQKALNEAAQSRKVTVDSIMNEAGLSETFRPVIEAIPDAEAARQQAKLLAQAGLSFGNGAPGGNGQRDTDALLKKVEKRLNLVP